MAAFTRVEEIQAWQKARVVTKMIYEMTSEGGFERDFGLRDQARRACVSVMANIAEGFGRRGDREFVRFLNIVHGSACEAQSHLYVAHDLGYLSLKQFDGLYALLSEVARMIYALISHLRGGRGQDGAGAL